MAGEANATMRRFGWPQTLLADYDHWAVLLRPAQVTLGSLILAAKGEARAFGALDPGAHAELAGITAVIEHVLGDTMAYERINYLMLMMVDPHVHFHVIPRYEGKRTFGERTLADAGWPGPPDLKSAAALDEATLQRLSAWLRSAFADALPSIG
jgi:diadenosine tetraphosphate (Ap4A) HIT family hydrolase